MCISCVMVLIEIDNVFYVKYRRVSETSDIIARLYILVSISNYSAVEQKINYAAVFLLFLFEANLVMQLTALSV